MCQTTGGLTNRDTASMSDSREVYAYYNAFQLLSKGHMLYHLVYFFGANRKKNYLIKD